MPVQVVEVRNYFRFVFFIHLTVGEITTSCTSGDVKLYRPYNTGPTNDGLALYCNNSKWVGVCDDGWSCHNARLICKKLGYPAALSKFHGCFKIC